ncbi:HET-domain-containing protein [Lophiostoma macrostomum CBS 122681]|uniref:HET-domain-containing protein n=1 Tax=Lophiostoma macrostomum CBS 122681 TaxID=1314788 RepID=A0A6A6SV87_9PLEO|nr:HET-domain-containing protein [Lophiostoma macrostomum CBS 122681]
MRLLRVQDDSSFSLVEYAGKNIPPYAILSHTWGDEEVTFQDVARSLGKDKHGYRKIKFCGEQAFRDGLQFFWVDACCIDKSSSAELSEALNSMFRYYQRAAKCYVHLSDVSVDTVDQIAQPPDLHTTALIKQSRWFTRGWALQEMLAPVSVHFFSDDGVLLGDKRSLENVVQEVTCIPTAALRGRPLSEFGVTERI